MAPARCPCARSARSRPGAPGPAPAPAPARSAVRVAERLRRQLDDRVVVDRAGRRDHDRARHVAPRVELGDHVDRRVPDHRRAADDRAPERVRAEDGLAEHVEHRVLRVVLVHGDLLEHDLALGVHVLERGAPHHVGHHVEGRRQVLVEHPRVDRGALLVGAGVELGAHAVEELVDLGRARSGRCRGTAGARGSARGRPPPPPHRASRWRRRSPGPRTARRAWPP